jgi:hypothetical protein
MRFQCLFCLMVASLVYGQAAPPSTAPATTPAAASAAQAPAVAPDNTSAAQIAPGDVVITLKGTCSDNAQGDACKTVITRAEFERVTDAMQPGMSPTIRRRAATVYARMLKMSAAAEKRGLDKGPVFDEKMALSRMQVLAQELNRAMQEDAAKVSDSDIDDYYKKNEGNYTQATFARIYVPRSRQFPSTASKPTASGASSTAKPAMPEQPTEAQKKAAEAAMQKLADTLRARAAQGEDPEKLAKEAHVAAGLPGNAPPVKMENLRRTALPANHQAVMELKPGEVSQVIADPNGGYYIYKMIAKETLPLDTVKPEIKNAISSQRYRDSMQSFQDASNTDLNDAYFGPVKNSAMPLPPRGARPVPQPGQDPE